MQGLTQHPDPQQLGNGYSASGVNSTVKPTLLEMAARRCRYPFKFETSMDGEKWTVFSTGTVVKVK